jgi:hypothetical protein
LSSFGKNVEEFAGMSQVAGVAAAVVTAAALLDEGFNIYKCMTIY